MSLNKIFDYIVVGTGPSAFFVCKSILEENPKARICILEAAGQRKDYQKSDLEFENVGQNFRTPKTTSTSYGGGSNLWHNTIAPLDEEDFEFRDWIPNSGWPISKIELIPYYKEVCNYLDVSYDIFDNDNLSNQLLAESQKIQFKEEVFEKKIYLQLRNRFYSSEHFNLLLKKFDITIQFNSPVLELCLDKDDPNKITSIKTGNPLTREIKHYKALFFILSSGALQTPKILLNSEIPKTLKSKIGEQLLDHPMGYMYQMKYKNNRKTDFYSNFKLNKSLNLKSGIKLTKEAQFEYHLPNSSFYVHPSYALGYLNHSEIAKQTILSAKNRLQKMQLPLNEINEIVSNPNLIREVLLYKTGVNTNHCMAEFLFYTEQYPHKNSKIGLSKKKDQWGYNKLTVNWNINENDIIAIRKMYDLINEYLVRENQAVMTFDKDQVHWRDRTRSAAHHMGTCKMSLTGTTGVVDSNQKLFGISNGYITDLSVFPTTGNANPTLTAMTLAYRLGKILVKSVRMESV